MMRRLTLPFRWCFSRLFRHRQQHHLRLRLGSIPVLPPFLSLPYTLPGGAISTHLHLMGLTGMGKSKLLASIAAQLILQGRPCAVIDPHADLAEDILTLLVEHGYFRHPDAFDKLLYVDFAHPDRAIPFNVLKGPYPSYEIARNLVEAVTRAWPTLAGGAAPQFENLLLAAASVLIDNDLPLTALTPLLTNDAYRAQLLQRVRDPQVLDFFRSRYEKGAHMNESTLRRAFLLTYPPPLRYSLGQSENWLNFRQLMDRQVSIICNLSGVDVQTQRLLGCLLTVGFETAALSRADLPPAARSPYHLILDEFSQFSAQSSVALERVLALTRKYGLYLTLAHQTWSQVSASLQGALQNTTFITFRLGQDDAAWGAARVTPFNPYQVKYRTAGTATHAGHPVYQTRSEQLAQWEYTLLGLKPREALLRVGNHTIAFRTAIIPPTSLQTHRRVKELTTRYAQEALQPHMPEMPNSPYNTLHTLHKRLQTHPQARKQEYAEDANRQAEHQPPQTTQPLSGTVPVSDERASLSTALPRMPRAPIRPVLFPTPTMPTLRSIHRLVALAPAKSVAVLAGGVRAGMTTRLLRITTTSRRPGRGRKAKIVQKRREESSTNRATATHHLTNEQ